MNLDDMTIPELQDLLVLVQNRIQQLITQQEQDTDNTRTEITQAVATLGALIGDDDPKGTNSIVAVRQFTPQEMAGAPEVAFPLIFEGMEILARAARDIAKVVGK